MFLELGPFIIVTAETEQVYLQNGCKESTAVSVE